MKRTPNEDLKILNDFLKHMVFLAVWILITFCLLKEMEWLNLPVHVRFGAYVLGFIFDVLIIIRVVRRIGRSH